MTFSDKVAAEAIRNAPSPGHAKEYGQGPIIGFDDCRWRGMRQGVMFDVCMAKFQQSSECRRLLLETGKRILAEATTDKAWGIGIKITNPARFDEKLWADSLLGKTLMEIREILQLQMKEQGEDYKHENKEVDGE